ncbi:MAG: transposase [Cyanobacteria bacterium P01_F01_bin.4]
MPEKFDPDKHYRRSIRLKGYDYASPGTYFVTICLQHRTCLLGNIINHQMQLNDAGQMVHDSWMALPWRFPQIILDAFVVMPNHFHGLITLQNLVGVPLVDTLDRLRNCPINRNVMVDKVPIEGVRLGDIVGAFKSITTHVYTAGVKCHGWEPFQKRLWQRNYYEHIVRNETSLETLRRYVLNNPTMWIEDQLHPNVDSMCNGVSQPGQPQGIAPTVPGFWRNDRYLWIPCATGFPVGVPLVGTLRDLT